jgi:hypothetical protein
LADELVGMLMDGIQGYCPPFVFFGAHPGDGADFGFWPDWEAIAEMQRTINPSVTPLDEYEYTHPIMDGIIILSSSDNVTVMDMDRNVLWTTA